MSRNNILDTTEKILKFLNKGEYSINYIAKKIEIRWKTTVKSLEFLKRIGLVKERKGNKTNKEERLFSLKN